LADRFGASMLADIYRLAAPKKLDIPTRWVAKYFYAPSASNAPIIAFDVQRSGS
jgi:hypothetical protein